MKRRDILKGFTFLPLAGLSGSPVQNLFASPGARNKFPLRAGPLVYQSIGVEPVINCRGTLTAIGGSTELPEVRAAMESAAQHYVQLDELADAVGKRLGEITGAEWGMVSSGCAAGMKHVTAACVSGGNPEKLIRIPDLDGFEKIEVIIPKTSRNFYDHAIRNVGVKIITVSTAEELQSAINSRTALIYMMSGRPASEGPLSLENVAQMAKPKNIPILVDAAAEILTIPNVHLQNGATVVAYSGGKAIRGPQCAGLLLGDKNILMAAWQASSPHHGPGRDNKVGREEHIGMLAAVEAWVTRNHQQEEKTWLSWLEHISKRVSGIESVKTSISEPQGLDNRTAMLTILWNPSALNITGEEVAEDFAKNKPRIALGGRTDDTSGTTSVNISAAMMQPGNEKVVADRLYEILSKKHPSKPSGMKPPSVTVSGVWDVDVDFSIGKGQHKLFIEKQDGNWLQGTHKSDFSMQDVSGTIEGNEVKLTSNYSAPGDSITFTFQGTHSNDSISGTLYMGEYRKAKFTAKRSNKPGTKTQISIPNNGRRSGNAW